ISSKNNFENNKLKPPRIFKKSVQRLILVTTNTYN
ncbi:unnamed protein product, partial [Allacma fusca]